MKHIWLSGLVSGNPGDQGTISRTRWVRGREGGERSLIGSGKSGKSLTKNGSKSECGNNGDRSQQNKIMKLVEHSSYKSFWDDSNYCKNQCILILSEYREHRINYFLHNIYSLMAPQAAFNQRPAALHMMKTDLPVSYLSWAFII